MTDLPTKNVGGRPTKYQAVYAHQAHRHCLLGATDAELAILFDVDVVTLQRWKLAHPEFKRMVIRGKAEADSHVAEALYHRAMGYSHDAVKIFMPPDAEQPVYAPYVQHYPPDTPAASLWLRNRQPAKWRDKVEVEHGGNVELIHAWVVGARRLEGEPEGPVIEHKPDEDR
jgi:hypothetical protein